MAIALVIGSANGVWDEVDEAFGLTGFDYIVAVKGAGTVWSGPVDVWATLHPEGSRNKYNGTPPIVEWMKQRADRGFPPAKLIVSHVTFQAVDGKRTAKAYPGVDIMIPHQWPGQTVSGSSGLLGVKAAFEVLKADKVVMAGIPLDSEAGRIDLITRWRGPASFRVGFNQAMPFLKDRVRAMSGYPQQQLGRPTAEWLSQ